MFEVPLSNAVGVGQACLDIYFSTLSLVWGLSSCSHFHDVTYCHIVRSGSILEICSVLCFCCCDALALQYLIPGLEDRNGSAWLWRPKCDTCVRLFCNLLYSTLEAAVWTPCEWCDTTPFTNPISRKAAGSFSKMQHLKCILNLLMNLIYKLKYIHTFENIYKCEIWCHQHIHPFSISA